MFVGHSNAAEQKILQELRATHVYSEVKEKYIYILQPYMPEEEGHKVLPQVERTPWTDKSKGKNEQRWTGGIKATAYMHGAGPDCSGKVPESAPCRGCRQRCGNVINGRHQVLAWESKAKLWKCHSANGVSLRCQEVLQRHWKTKPVTGN